jgi:hypothetical protein
MNVKETTKKKNKPRNRPGGRQRSARAKQTKLKLVINLEQHHTSYEKRRTYQRSEEQAPPYISQMTRN